MQVIYNLQDQKQAEAARVRLDKLVADKKKVEIKLYKENRTNKQNRYFHKCVGIIAEDLGYTLEEMKTVLKREFGYYYEKNGKKFVRSTAEMNTAEMAKFTDEVRNWAAREGYYLPSPDEI